MVIETVLHLALEVLALDVLNQQFVSHFETLSSLLHIVVDHLLVYYIFHEVKALFVPWVDDVQTFHCSFLHFIHAYRLHSKSKKECPSFFTIFYFIIPILI